MLNRGIGLAYVPKEFAKVDEKFEVMVRETLIPAVVVKPPFWKKGTVRVHRKKITL